MNHKTQSKETPWEFTKGVGCGTMVTKVAYGTINHTERRLDNMETVIITLNASNKRDRRERLEEAQKELSSLFWKWLVEVVAGLVCLFTFDKLTDPVMGGVLLGIMLVTLPKAILDLDKWESKRPKLLETIERLSSEVD